MQSELMREAAQMFRNQLLDILISTFFKDLLSGRKASSRCRRVAQPGDLFLFVSRVSTNLRSLLCRDPTVMLKILARSPLANLHISLPAGFNLALTNCHVSAGIVGR